MSPVHLHLLLNHVPVVGTFFVLLILGVAYWRRDSVDARLGLVLLVGLATLTVAVFLSGEPAEEALEHLSGVSEQMIHAHEEAAEASLIAMGVVGALALLALIVCGKRSLPRWIVGSALAAVLLVGALLAWTANLGGRIRHTEIAGATLPPAEHEVNGER